VCLNPLQQAATRHSHALHRRTAANSFQQTATHCNNKLQHSTKPVFSAEKLPSLTSSILQQLQQHTATHYNTLQHTATPLLSTENLPSITVSTIQRTATRCNTLQQPVLSIAKLPSIGSGASPKTRVLKLQVFFWDFPPIFGVHFFVSSLFQACL